MQPLREARAESASAATERPPPPAAEARAEAYPPGSQNELISGRYELLDMVGAGGMGAVYRARDVELDEIVAIKMLQPGWAQDDSALTRFRLEVKLARRVTHPNVARTYDLGSHQGTPFLTMELVDGHSLASRLAVNRKVSLVSTLRLGADVSRGLSAAHAAGVVHRDLKPENIIMARAPRDNDLDRAVITDFGIAIPAKDPRGEHASETIVGTPAYMAPEQVRGTELDGRADVYAFGVLLYELLTGSLPFFADNPYGTAVARLSADPLDPRQLDPTIPAPVAELILSMMAREREDRPDAESVREWVDRLRGESHYRESRRWVDLAGAEGAGSSRGEGDARGFAPTPPPGSSGSSKEPASYSAMKPAAQALYDRAQTHKDFGDADQAVALLRGANVLEPGNPFIMSSLGVALVRLWSRNDDRELLAEAEDCSLRALAIDSALGETFNTIGVLRVHQGDLRAAVRAFEAALVRAPRLAEPHSYLGRLLSETGRTDEADHHLRAAVLLDPRDHNALSELARIAALQGNWVRAESTLERGASESRHALIRATQARYAVWRNDRDRLRELVDELAANRDDPTLVMVHKLFMPIWAALASSEPLDTKDERIVRIEEASRAGSRRLAAFFLQLLVEIRALSGHTWEALDALEEAKARGLVDVLWLDRCPALATLRPDPRFARTRAAVALRAANLWR